MISSPIDEIKNRLDIVEVIGSYIKLQKAGANYRAVCPFHSEKKPSFFVSPARQIWHCFGCGLGGDIFGFVKGIEGVEFGDALRILAQKAGVELKRQDPKLKTERQGHYEICELACRFFEKQLEAGKTGKEAKEYLFKRGLTEESVKKWRLGFSPDTWQGLSDFLVGKGYKREEIAKVGLVIRKQEGNFYDRFRSRIMFPIFDLNSQVVGFGGRIFGTKAEKEIAKYMNTPSTLLYDKSRILYGLDKSKVEIRKKGNCILVEGYIDVILSSQAGYGNVAATSGTALTPYQLKILKRYSESILTAFDMDVAGQGATKRGIDLAQAQGFDIKVITMPVDKDPADVISESPEEWEKLIRGAKSILEFYFETTFSKFDRETPEGKQEISKILLPVIKRIPNKIVQAHWIQALGAKLEVKEQDIREELQRTKIEDQGFQRGVGEAEEGQVQLRKKTRKELLEERLVILILKSQENLNFLAKEDFNLFSFQIVQILNHFKEDGSQSELPAELTGLLNYFSLKSEVENFEDDIEKEFKGCLEAIRALEVKNKLGQISSKIKRAEQEKDGPEAEKLIGEFNLRSKSLHESESA
ncbi:DNA primase [Patescibacteria group bacterium]|nr:DNA primase [Patescibacteria group bacterium]